VLGFDGDDASAFERTACFVKKFGLTDVQIIVLTPFPGTALHRRLAREGRLLCSQYWDECTLFDVVYQPAMMSPEELEEGFYQLMKAIYSPATSARRARLRSACWDRI
jgi:radical SAM superfamily enzyme YgiQ (UPF0313 family)